MTHSLIVIICRCIQEHRSWTFKTCHIFILVLVMLFQAFLQLNQSLDRCNCKTLNLTPAKPRVTVHQMTTTISLQPVL